MAVTLYNLKPYLLNVLANFLFAGYNIISKVSLDKGMSRYVLVIYGQMIRMLTTAILPLLFERTKGSKINLTIWRDIFFLGLNRVILNAFIIKIAYTYIPVLGRTLYYAGLQYTSSAFVACIGNLTPSMILIVAFLFRMETLDILKLRSQAKIWGTLVAFEGATVMTPYRGIIVISPPFQHSIHGATTSMSSDKEDWIKGSVVLLIGFFSLAAFYILQSAMLKKYPAPISLTLLTCLMGTLQGTVKMLVLERKVSSWRLHWDFRLLAPVYSGVMISGGATYLQTLAIRERGLVFMTAFRPLGTILVAMMGLLILGEVLHLGSVVGAVLVFAGLYMVIWGEGKEENSKQIERESCDPGMSYEPPTIVETKENVQNT